MKLHDKKNNYVLETENFVTAMRFAVTNKCQFGHKPGLFGPVTLATSYIFHCIREGQREYEENHYKVRRLTDYYFVINGLTVYLCQVSGGVFQLICKDFDASYNRYNHVMVRISHKRHNFRSAEQYLRNNFGILGEVDARIANR